MDTTWNFITEKLKIFREHWAIYSAIGTGALYLLGYLITRFQLTMLGVSTSLDVLEEQYFYAGARFAVYLLATLPSLVLLLLPLVALTCLLLALVRAVAGTSGGATLARWWRNVLCWWQNPVRLRLAGVIFSVLIIQFVMRQCFLLSNLLLAKSLPEPRWLQGLLLDTSDLRTSLFFAGLLGAGMVTAGLFVAARESPAPTATVRTLDVLLALLMSIQLLLLPVNYACLVTTKYFPRIAPIDSIKTESGQAAWLVWENDKGATFFVSSPANPSHNRALVTVPRKDLENLQITGYDPLLSMMFGNQVPADATLVQ